MPSDKGDSPPGSDVTPESLNLLGEEEDGLGVPPVASNEASPPTEDSSSSEPIASEDLLPDEEEVAGVPGSSGGSGGGAAPSDGGGGQSMDVGSDPGADLVNQIAQEMTQGDKPM